MSSAPEIPKMMLAAGDSGGQAVRIGYGEIKPFYDRTKRLNDLRQHHACGWNWDELELHIPKHGFEAVEVRAVLMAPSLDRRAVYPRAGLDSVIGLPLPAYLGEDELHMGANWLSDRDRRGGGALRSLSCGRSRRGSS